MVGRLNSGELTLKRKRMRYRYEASFAYNMNQQKVQMGKCVHYQLVLNKVIVYDNMTVKAVLAWREWLGIRC